MNIIQQARDFVQRLLHPNDPRRCPRCGKRMTKKNGTRRVTIRDLDSRGAYPDRHQNWWCHLCKEPYYVRYPGQCPLEVGGMDLQQLTWLDLVGV